MRERDRPTHSLYLSIQRRGEFTTSSGQTERETNTTRKGEDTWKRSNGTEGVSVCERERESERTNKRVRVCMEERENSEHSRVGAPLERLTI